MLDLLIHQPFYICPITSLEKFLAKGLQSKMVWTFEDSRYMFHPNCPPEKLWQLICPPSAFEIVSIFLHLLNIEYFHFILSFATLIDRKWYVIIQFAFFDYRQSWIFWIFFYSLLVICISYFVNCLILFFVHYFHLYLFLINS